jgi:LysM repeat protein
LPKRAFAIAALALTPLVIHAPTHSRSTSEVGRQALNNPPWTTPASEKAVQARPEVALFASRLPPKVTVVTANQPDSPHLVLDSLLSITGPSYTVQRGDTLSGISARWGVPLATLVAANHIANPNLILVGEVLVSGGASTTAQAAAVVAPSAAPAPAPSAPAQVQSSTPALPAGFACIRQRESGGNYAINTGNGYYGAYQFSSGTWADFDGYAEANLAPPAVQDEKAALVYSQRGYEPWPNTARACGL